MQWTRIEVDLSGLSAETDARLGVGELGLDATAENMHDEFVSSLPHLEEVQQRHESVISDLSNMIETSKSMSRNPQPVAEMLSEMGGSMVSREVTIPLPTAIPEELIIETMVDDSRNLVRLIAPERFGGVIRHFSLSDGDSIVGARWSDGKLVLKLD